MKGIRNYTPGPVEVAANVLEAQHGPQGLHVGPEFSQTYVRATENLQQIFGTRGYVGIIPGSGTLTNEMAMRAMLDEGQTALILDAGYFSNILKKSVEACGATPVLMPIAEGKPADPETVRAALAQRHIDLLCFTHVETSTGLQQPVEALAKVAAEAGVPVMVDSVSALGTSPVLMDKWGISVMTSASQKGLGSVPGLGLIAVADHAWTQIDAKRSPRGGYSDVARWRDQYETEKDWHPGLSTMPVAVIRALDVALSDMMREGLDARYARHNKARDVLCDAVERCGLELQITNNSRAAGVTAVRTNGRFKSSELVAYLIAEHGLRIAGGFGANREDVFRVAHMGVNAQIEAMEPVITGIEGFLSQKD